jgi:hypothetical protein
MQKPLQKAQTENLVALAGTEAENILGAAQKDAPFEKLAKFRKGEYFKGEELVPLGTEYIAHAISWTKCWIKFLDGEVADRRVYRVALGEQPPEREDLDDLDQDNWPEGVDGNPADPWSLQYLIPLERISDCEVVIFTTSSFGGRRAVADLCAAYAKRLAKSVAGCGQPIVRLAKADMPTKKFGKVPRPHFEIVGWDEPPSEVDDGPPPVASEDEFGLSTP